MLRTELEPITAYYRHPLLQIRRSTELHAAALQAGPVSEDKPLTVGRWQAYRHLRHLGRQADGTALLTAAVLRDKGDVIQAEGVARALLTRNDPQASAVELRYWWGSPYKERPVRLARMVGISVVSRLMSAVHEQQPGAITFMMHVEPEDEERQAVLSARGFVADPAASPLGNQLVATGKLIDPNLWIKHIVVTGQPKHPESPVPR